MAVVRTKGAIMPIALPIPRILFNRLNYPWLTHITRQSYLLGSAGAPGIVRTVIRRDGEWADCNVDLVGTSGFGSAGRLFRDYSVVDFEFSLRNRGSYTYFFAGDPSTWGLVKNFETWTEATLLKNGFAFIRIATKDFLDTYKGPIFWRPDDKAVVIRGSYSGRARVKSLPIS
jgi:hypothetical protein